MVGWSIAIALVGLWIPAVINLTGVRNMGSFQVWTTVLKFIPLAIMSTVGLFFIKLGNFSPWNVSGDTSLSAIGGAMAICLFSYLGVETAAVAAAKVRDPERSGQLDRRWCSWAGNLVALAVIVSGIGALNGWTMICAEMPLAAATDGLFPSRFGRLSARGVPAFGIISSTALASVAVVISYTGASGSTVFTPLVLMTGITAAVPYAFSALAQIKWRWQDNQPIHTPRFARDLAVAVLAFVFSLAFLYYSRNSGDTWYVVWGPFLMAGGAFLLGIPVYLAQRKQMTEPVPVPSYR